MSFSTKSTCINNYLTNSISSSCSYHNHSRKLVFSYVSSIPNSKLGAEIRVRCSASSPKRGFGPSSKKSSAPVKKEEKKNTKRLPTYLVHCLFNIMWDTDRAFARYSSSYLFIAFAGNQSLSSRPPNLIVSCSTLRACSARLES